MLLVGCGATGVLAAGDWTLRGVLIEPESIQFSVDLADGQGAFWIPLGSSRYGVRAVSYDATGQQLTLESGGQEIVLNLADGRLGDSGAWVGESPATVAELQELARAAALNPRLASDYAGGVAVLDVTPPGRQRSEAGLRRREARQKAQLAAHGGGVIPEVTPAAESSDSDQPGEGVSIPPLAVVNKGLNPRLWTE